MNFFPKKLKVRLFEINVSKKIVLDSQIVDNSKKKPTYNRLPNACFISLSWVEDIIFYNGDFYGPFGLKSRVGLIEN